MFFPHRRPQPAPPRSRNPGTGSGKGTRPTGDRNGFRAVSTRLDDAGDHTPR